LSICTTEVEAEGMGSTFLLTDLTIRLLVVVLVYRDARKRDWNGDGFANKPWKWALGAATLWYFTLPLYLMRRRGRPAYSPA
jgi:hypothetical protein